MCGHGFAMLWPRPNDIRACMQALVFGWVGCAADAGVRDRDDGSERLVGIELRRCLVGQALFSPGLLHLRPVGGPQRLAHGLQALGDGQRLLGRPVLGHDRRSGRCR